MSIHLYFSLTCYLYQVIDETGKKLRKYVNTGLAGKPFLNFKEFHENALGEMQVDPPVVISDYEKVSRFMKTGL